MHERFHASYLGKDVTELKLIESKSMLLSFRHLSGMSMLVPLLEGIIGRSNKLAWPTYLADYQTTLDLRLDQRS